MCTRWLALCALALACNGDNKGDDATTPPPDDTGHTGATHSVTTETGTEADPIRVVAGPALQLVGDAAPLTGVLVLEVDRPVRVTLTCDDGERTWSYEVPGAPVAAIDVPVVGGRAERTVAVSARLTDDEGQTLDVDVGALTLPKLPAGLGLMNVEVADVSAMEPGYTLLPASGHIGLVDSGGEFVWLAKSFGAVHELLPADPGSMAYRYVSSRTHVLEVDVRGRLVDGWHAAQNVNDPDTRPVDVLALHHDVQRMPDGSLISLSVERRFLSYPTSEIDTLAPFDDAWVAGDVLVNFGRDGSILGSWPLLDLLDPERIAYDGVRGNYWEDFAPWQPDDIKDWSHGNAVWYDAPTDRFIVGLRHQDAVVAIDRGTGELAWIVGPPAHWRAPWSDKLLVADASVEVLPYHMHGAKMTPAGTLLVFDNGNRRASAFEPPVPDEENASRAVELQIDLVAGTFRELWSYQTPEGLFSGSLGDVDALPITGNRLITWGNPKAPDPRGAVRVQELAPDDRTVFDLWLPAGTIFRAERVPGLLP